MKLRKSYVMNNEAEYAGRGALPNIKKPLKVCFLFNKTQSGAI